MLVLERQGIVVKEGKLASDREGEEYCVAVVNILTEHRFLHPWGGYCPRSRVTD